MAERSATTNDPAAHRAEFLTQMRRVPGAVAIIATSDGGERRGMAATAWTSVCADPPTMLVCVNRQASVHQPISKTGRFAINLLAATEAETVSVFSAQRGLDGDARFTVDQWLSGPLGQPLLRQAVAAFELRAVDSHTYGTHDIIIGEVQSMQLGPDEPAMVYCNGAICAAGPAG